MTKAEAVDWINTNLPTTTIDGTDFATFSHPTDGTKCPACGIVHEQDNDLAERIPVDRLAGDHHTTMANAHADALGNGAAVDTVAQAVVDDATAQDMGHDRFYGQLDGVTWP